MIERINGKSLSSIERQLETDLVEDGDSRLLAGIDEFFVAKDELVKVASRAMSERGRLASDTTHLLDLRTRQISSALLESVNLAEPEHRVELASDMLMQIINDLIAFAGRYSSDPLMEPPSIKQIRGDLGRVYAELGVDGLRRSLQGSVLGITSGVLGHILR